MNHRQDEVREWLQGESMEISQEEAQEALNTAETVWNFILSRISDGTHC